MVALLYSTFLKFVKLYCKTDVEAEWIDSLDLAIGEVILCSSMQDKTKKTFESYSNEFILNGGLRVKNKLRKV